MTVQNVKIVIDGDSSKAVAAAREVSKALTDMKGSATVSATGTVAAGVAIGNILSEIAEKAYELAKAAISAFTDTGDAVYQMQLVMGGSAEEMSRLKFVGGLVGTSTDQMTRAFMFAANHLAANDKVVKELGISYKDLQSSQEPTIELLARFSDRFIQIKDPIQRANAMRDMFGRGIQGMLPLLALGGEGIRRLARESDFLGTTMSTKDVQAARVFKLQWGEVKAALSGAAIDIGRKMLPVLSFLAGAVMYVTNTIKDMIGWVGNFFKTWDKQNQVLKIVIISLGIAAALMIAYAVATGVASVAMGILSAIFQTTGIPEVIILVTSLIVAIIAVAQNSATFGDVIIKVSEILGTILGKALGVIVSALSTMVKVISVVVDQLLNVVKLGAELTDFLHITDNAVGWVQGIQDGLTKVTETLTGGMDKFAEDAWDKGGAIGKRLGEGLVNAIKSLKMPSFDDLGLPDPNATAGPEYVPNLGGGGGKKAGGTKVDRKKEILDFFTNLVNAARDALNAARQAAIDARDKMKKMGEDIAKTMADALDITALSESSFAKYLGVGALMKSMRKKLAEMKEFAADIKKLAAMGLPQEMLIQIANAGVSGGGLDTARMLLANPESFKELQDIQSQINAETAAAGAAIATVVVQPQVTAAEKAAAAQQSQFLNYLATAQQIGYVATADDLSASRANVHNEVTINTDYFASPEQIAAAVAWALQTGTALGMKPAGLTPISGKTKKKKK